MLPDQEVRHQETWHVSSGENRLGNGNSGRFVVDGPRLEKAPVRCGPRHVHVPHSLIQMRMLDYPRLLH
jgi:hypothetical protein